MRSMLLRRVRATSPQATSPRSRLPAPAPAAAPPQASGHRLESYSVMPSPQAGFGGTVPIQCNGEDHTEKLPDEVLSHILSFLPFKDRILSTNKVSKRFRTVSESLDYRGPAVLKPHKVESRWGKKYALDINAAVSRAYNIVLGHLQGDLPIKQPDKIGISQKRWKEFTRRIKEHTDKRSGEVDSYFHPSASTGYAIEDIAGHFLRLHPEKARLKLQDTQKLRNTRPDVSIDLERELEVPEANRKTGLVDITSSAQAGHIFKKEGEWISHRDIPYVAESLYPSIDFDDPSNTKTQITPEELAAIEEASRRRRLEQQTKEREAIGRQRKEFYQGKSHTIRGLPGKRKGSPNQRDLEGLLAQGIEPEVSDEPKAKRRKVIGLKLRSFSGFQRDHGFPLPADYPTSPGYYPYTPNEEGVFKPEGEEPPGEIGWPIDKEKTSEEGPK